MSQSLVVNGLVANRGRRTQWFRPYECQRLVLEAVVARIISPDFLRIIRANSSELPPRSQPPEGPEWSLVVGYASTATVEAYPTPTAGPADLIVPRKLSQLVPIPSAPARR
jgi:hypothetical protein